MGSKDTCGMASKDNSGVAVQTKAMIEMLSVELIGNGPDNSQLAELHVHGHDVKGALQYDVSTCFPAGERVVPDIHDGFQNGQVEVNATCRNHIVRMTFTEQGGLRYYRFSTPGKGWGNYIPDGEEFTCQACSIRGIYHEAYGVNDALCQTCRSAGGGSASG